MNCPDGQIHLHVSDLRDASTLENLPADVDTIFHLACLGVRHSLRFPNENHDVNATVTLRLLRAAYARGINRFVHVSTSEVYGTALTTQMDEMHPTMPSTVYGASKLAGECYARAFFDTYGLPVVIVRPFNSFGPRCHHEGDSGEVIPKFMLRCMAQRPLNIFGDGTQTRDFTFVDDTASGIYAVGVHSQAVGETVNIGSGQDISINKLAETIKEVVGLNSVDSQFLESRPGDVRRLCADTRKAETHFGFAPKISFRDGLEELFRWYQTSDRTVSSLLKEEFTSN